MRTGRRFKSNEEGPGGRFIGDGVGNDTGIATGMVGTFSTFGCSSVAEAVTVFIEAIIVQRVRYYGD